MQRCARSRPSTATHLVLHSEGRRLCDEPCTVGTRDRTGRAKGGREDNMCMHAYMHLCTYACTHAHIGRKLDFVHACMSRLKSPFLLSHMTGLRFVASDAEQREWAQVSRPGEP